MTTIQNYQPTTNGQLSTSTSKPTAVNESASLVTQNKMLPTGSDDATTNNRFAGLVLSQQTNGPITSTVTANKHGGMTLSTTVDMDGNGQNEASLTSAFDDNGTLRSNSYTMDNSGDGVVDYGEAYTYDSRGSLTGHVVVEDTDLNGTMDKQSFSQDTNGNGLFDKKTTTTFSDDGNLASRSVEHDVNEDGIMDFAFNETFDAEGNRTSFGATIFDDGLFGTAGIVSPCPCPGASEVEVPATPVEPDAPEEIISAPAAGGASSVDGDTPDSVSILAVGDTITVAATDTAAELEVTIDALIPGRSPDQPKVISGDAVYVQEGGKWIEDPNYAYDSTSNLFSHKATGQEFILLPATDDAPAKYQAIDQQIPGRSADKPKVTVGDAVYVQEGGKWIEDPNYAYDSTSNLFSHKTTGQEFILLPATDDAPAKYQAIDEKISTGSAEQPNILIGGIEYMYKDGEWKKV